MKQKLFTIAKGWHEYDETGSPIGGTPLINGVCPKFSKIEHLRKYVEKIYEIKADDINFGFSWSLEKSTTIFDYKIVAMIVNY